VTVGEIVYRITGDDSGLRAALNNTKSTANQTAQSVSGIAEAVNSTAENASATQAAMNGIAASAETAAAAASTAAAAVETTAQSAAISQEAYEAAVSSQQRLSQQIQATENKLAELKAMEADMSAARQSGDISAAAFQRYQHEVQQTADKLVTLNIQNAAATERIAQMNASLAATEAVSNNAAEAVSRIGESAETTTEAARDVTRATQEVGNEAESAASKSTKAYEKIGSAAQKALGMITKAAITASAAASMAAASDSIEQVGTNAAAAATALSSTASAAARAAENTSQAAAGAERMGASVSAASGSIASFANSSQAFMQGPLAQMGQVSSQAQGVVRDLDDVGNAAQNAGQKGEEAGKKGESTLGKIGSAAGKAALKIGKISLAAVGAASATVAAVSKAAIDSYANYEQLVGGVETLFGDSADVIQGYAEEAFSTVGMSCNAYMETVTGFAASLVSSLGGDTATAAQKANTAVADMADNANKMGTDMQSIQNAYQGFAKQNYTMLDNLKLGYGGTKEEMERLLADAAKLQKTKLGIDIDYDISKFSDIVDAIHVIQEDMGITGTTAKEASTTIQGSISTMQAAWQNLMTGIADPTQDFDKLLGDVIDSVVTVSNNLMPRIMAVLPQMATGITELTENLLPLIPDTLEQMLPSVIEGTNSLIAALLDTLSSIADTAIPIVTENADEIINTLLSGLISAIPSLASSAADLCTAIITAILDNADIITQGAVDIVLALAQGLTDNLDDLIPAIVRAVMTIAETLIDNAEDVIEGAYALITAIAKGLAEAAPMMVQEVPVIIGKLVTAFTDPENLNVVVEIPVAICKGILDGLKSYDWTEGAAQTMKNLGDALAEADGYAVLGSQEEADARLQEALDELEAQRGELTGAYKGLADSLSASADDTAEAAEEAGTTVSEAIADSMPDAGVDGVVDKSEMLDTALKELEDKYAVHKVTEEEYWAGRKALLEQYRNEEDAEWWKLYDKVTEHYDKLADTEAKAAEKAAKEAEQAKKDAENALKTSVEDKFREIETEQLEKGYDDSWLLEQERAFIETLDHNSEVYKDYNLKLLKEQKSTDDKAAKEVETAAKKQRDTLEKAYDSVVKSRDSLASSLKGNSGDIFNSSEETDKRTGAKTKSNKIDLSGYEKKLAAKKKLASKIAELYEKNVPGSLITELLKQDPEVALDNATQLLKNPKKISKIKSLYKDDEGVSDIIANMVTENSDEFEKLGTDAGTLFGDSFMEAFKANWEQSMKDVFDGNYVDAAAANVSAANSSASISANTSAANTTAADSQDTSAAAKRTSASSGSPVYKVVDLDGKYVAKVVAQENKRAKTASGG
jgi:phage-related protein